MIFFIFFISALSLGERPNAAQPNLEVTEIENALQLANATDSSTTLKWVRESLMKNKPANDASSELIIATADSKSSAGKHRIIFSEGYGKSIFSFFHNEKMELLIDTHSSEGFKPYLLEPNQNKRLIASESTSCQKCHSADFTPIWSLQKNAREFFSPDKSGFQPPLTDALTLSANISGNFVNVLVKRAASNLFDKITTRHPNRLKKHAALLLKLLMNCPVPAQQWNDFLAEVQKETPDLLAQWRPILEGWPSYIKAPAQTAYRESSGTATIEGSLHPLLLLHYLGVPPQNIFLFSAIKEEDRLFESIDSFSQLSGPELGNGKRWGPLGAYAIENDDLRGHLAARIAYTVFEKMNHPTSSDYKHPDIGAFLPIKPDLSYSGPNRERHSDYLDDPFFLFNIYGVYEIPRLDGPALPPKFTEEKQKWCQQIESGKANFTSIAGEQTLPPQIKDQDPAATHSDKQKKDTKF